MACKHHLPGFRTTCVLVGIVYVLAGGSILVRGGSAALAEFGVPAPVLASAHYADAIWWVYVHMVVIGLLTAVVGLTGRSMALRVWFPRVMLVAHVYYAYLDFRHSDSAVGNGLYEGPLSVVPGLMAAFVGVLFAHLSVCRGDASAGDGG